MDSNGAAGLHWLHCKACWLDLEEGTKGRYYTRVGRSYLCASSLPGTRRLHEPTAAEPTTDEINDAVASIQTSIRKVA